MLINTKFLGEVEVNEQDILTFQYGVLGIEDENNFILIPFEEESPFLLLQSIKTPQIGFITVYPFVFSPNYTFELSEEDQEDLKLTEETEGDLLTFSIVTLKESLSKSTINLLAPVVINMKKKIGKQIVLQDNKYPLRFEIGELERSVK